MRKTFLAAAAAFSLAGMPASAQDVDEILAKYVAARGGAAALKAVQTVRMTGKMTVGGREVPFSLEMKRPNKMRLDMTVDGLPGTQAFDGASGWVLMPFSGIKKPEPMPPEAIAEAQNQADFDGPLVDYAAKGHKVRLAGTEAVDGKNAHKLEVTLKGGGVRTIYLDASTSLEVKSEGTRTLRGKTVDQETYAADYRKVGELMFPHSLRSGFKGAPTEKMTIEKVETNVVVDDSRFKLPPANEPGGAI